MGRAAAGWSVRDLAREAQVGVATVNRFEMGRTEATPAIRAAMQRALEAAGVEFLDADGFVGVRIPADRAKPTSGASADDSAESD